MEITAEKELQFNSLLFGKNARVEINEVKKEVQLNIAYNKGICNLEDVKELIIDNKIIIKNGEIKTRCEECTGCIFCKNIRIDVYSTPRTFEIEEGFYCGYKKTYSETIENLKRSKIKRKSDIELKKAYEKINEKFKYRRERFITEESIKEVISDIEQCMTPSMEMEAVDEYGHLRIELEKIRLLKNKYGYSVSHYGKMGDNGWASEIYLSGKCNIDKLENELRKKFSKIENDL